MSGLSPKTVTNTVLQYTVDGLSPYVTYTVECTSSNGEDSCDSNMDTIRMPSAGECVIMLLCIFILFVIEYWFLMILAINAIHLYIITSVSSLTSLTVFLGNMNLFCCNLQY